MRPLLLELVGFGAFRQPTSLDFRDADFFALVGPTGAGKSTVIDAICFALYGNVPRYDDQRLVGAALSLGAVEARVHLRFSVGDEEYDAVRIVRRGGGQQQKVSTRQARLERSRDGLVLASRESEMRAAVEQLVGLSFEDFTRCVVLPQGEFSRFLHDKPADRQALLVRLLDLGVYQRVMSRANARATEHQRRLDRIDGQLSELPFVDDTGRRELADAQVRVERAQQFMDGADATLAALEVERLAARSAAEQLQRTERALAAIEVPATVVDDGDTLGALRRELLDAEQTLAAAMSAADRAEDELLDLPDLGALERLVELHTRIGNGRRVVAERIELADLLTRELAAADGPVMAAVAEVERANHELVALERAHRAHVIAQDLVPGEPCPVCEHPVERLPLSAAPPALAAARRSLERSETGRRDVEQRRAEVARRLADADAQVAAGQARLAELEHDVRGWPDPVALSAEVARVTERKAAAAVTRRAQRSASDVVAAKRRAVEQLVARSSDLTAQYHRQRDAVAALSPPPPGTTLAEGWQVLAAWSTVQLDALRIERDELVRTSAAIEHGLDQQLAELRTIVAGAGVPVGSGASPSQLRQALTRRRAELDERADALERATARRAALDAQRDAETQARTVAGELARQLKADRFQRWLVEETFEVLAQRASEILLRLSDGQFSLSVGSGGEYQVVDHTAADEVRPVRTLSGGETFQASLALALALSDHVMSLSDSTGSGRLESIFLDEGFGSLDEHSLETVAATIETLHEGGRTVGIVTHVRELADRVPVKFVVTRGAGGATVERVET